MSLRLFAIALAVLFVASCAPKKQEIAQPFPEPPAAPARIVLPELPPEPEPVAEPAEKATGTEAVLLEENVNGRQILLNFENTDIRTIIETFSEILGINYILTPGISGTVTIQSYNKFPVDDLFHVFLSVLEINGLTAVRDGVFYRIVPLDTARQQPLDIDSGREARVTLNSTFVTQIIPLQYVKASEIANILRNLMPRGTDLIVYEPTNLLIVTALPPTLVKFMKIIAALDIHETESDAIRTFVYPVENGVAKKLETILKAVYPQTRSVTTTARKATTSKIRRAVTPALTTAGATALPGDIGNLSVTAYEDINALIFKCTPKTYVALLQIMKKIDIPVKQVVIEVLIAEITLTDSTEFGLQWLMQSGATTAGFTKASSVTSTTLPVITSPTFSAIVSGTIDRTFVDGFLSALATESRLNVLASPQILALDNKEAEIKIGDEVPTATGLTQSGTTDTFTTTGQIQYKTVGTILTVTPHITDKGNVSMKLVVESSSIGENVTIGTTGTFPSFSTRRATTSAVVATGHTLFLGGLISDTKTVTRTGIPGLSKIPVLGYLFGTTIDTVSKRELLVMVTPHVIANQKAADKMTRVFQNRVKTIKKRIMASDLDRFIPAEPGAVDPPRQEDPAPAAPTTP